MSEIVIYEDGTVRLEAEVSQETLWLTQEQIAQLFGVQRPAITKHLSNIFKSGELDEKVVCSILERTTKHGAISNKTQKKKIKTYNLDAIISIGYRVNSKRATKFRIWATDILKKYILDGYAINKEKLQQQKLKELDATLAMIRQAVTNKELSTTEAKGFVEIIGNYAKSWALLQGYDEQSLEEFKGHFIQRKRRSDHQRQHPCLTHPARSPKRPKPKRDHYQVDYEYVVWGGEVMSGEEFVGDRV